METFWDSSAVVALLLQEPDTGLARAAWSKTKRAWAWRWLVIEVEAALARRRAPPAAWSQWSLLLENINLVDLNPRHWDALRAFNRALHLRAADAGHLFVYERACSAIPGLQLVSFDMEINRSARKLGLALLARK